MTEARDLKEVLARVAALLEPQLVANAVRPNDPPQEVHPVHIRARDLRAALGQGDPR